MDIIETLIAKKKFGNPLESLTVTKNGTYEAEKGGFNPVVVEVTYENAEGVSY